ncbi:MAG: class I SAM-dependent methyltransferase [Thermoprotei archaeon]|nr:class I SAM-dependent methyltransferase [Thermoprotei archaeon]
MQKVHDALRSFHHDVNRVQGEIWSMLDVHDKIVVDIGIGDSTMRLADLGAVVIGIDREVEVANSLARRRKVAVIVSDLLFHSFRKRIADLVVFCFTLHEINPSLHVNVLSVAREIAPLVMIVEPSLHGCRTYEEYADIWRKAMHSIGKFEDYKPVEYWMRVLERSGFEILKAKKVEWRVDIPYRVFENLIEDTIVKWKELNVEMKYITELEGLLERVKREGIRWSDIHVLLAEDKHSP